MIIRPRWANCKSRLSYLAALATEESDRQVANEGPMRETGSVMPLNRPVQA
jgi:hypothetical protein